MMTKKTMKALALAGSNLDLDVEERPRYSGRGMYGKDTCGIVVANTTELLQVVAYAAFLLAEPDEGANLEFVEEIGNFRTDTMGRAIIVY